jgi:electron transport complex protein RnfA
MIGENMRKTGSISVLALALLLLTLLTASCVSEHRFVKRAAFKKTNSIEIDFAGAVDEAWAKDIGNYAVYEEPDPDIHLAITRVTLGHGGRTVVLSLEDDLDKNVPHIVTLTEIMSDGKSQGTAILKVVKPYLGILLSILIGAMVINNFVFSKYLGLCVFFGCSQKRSTAIGMGVTFTIVIICSAMMAWFLYQFVLKPYHLDFLQIIVFIGLVSLFVQAVDTILRKVNPALFKSFGVYLVLVIANCIIIAVPLMLADNEYNAWESLMLAVGAGLGFLIALFLMACVRERLELADVPPSFRGLPIAFIVGGLFALSFMGFSGMSLF